MTAQQEKARLLEFYGIDCPHCVKMESLVKKLKKEEKITIEQLEVWSNPKNAELMQQYDTGLCGGVPFFFNTKTRKFICGSTTYEKFKQWALGK
ncbi:MAG: hypothetical protein HY832_04110 [Candidatus Aenigmarchaeota archaeon]|nr:hypothetical protein [Candidatus Aenigmarchaeota archaeon]